VFLGGEQPVTVGLYQLSDRWACRPPIGSGEPALNKNKNLFKLATLAAAGLSLAGLSLAGLSLAGLSLAGGLRG
jgi:hypothetical protein